MPRDTESLLREYNVLLARKREGGLSPDAEARLELLSDVLLELGTLPPPDSATPARGLRADMVLEVSFSSQDEVVKAYSKNIGAGGISVRMSRPHPMGSVVELRIRLPGEGPPLVTQGRVVWCRDEHVGVEFVGLPPADERRLKELLIENESVLKRIRTVLTTDVRELARAAGPAPVGAREVDTRPLVLVGLSDPQRMSVVLEVLRQGGLRAETTAGDTPPAILIADPRSRLLGTLGPGVRLVLMDVSGPDALMGSLIRLRPAAFVRPRAPAAEVLQAVAKLLRER